MALAHNSTKEALQHASNLQIWLDRRQSKFVVSVTVSFIFIYINTIMFVTLWSRSVFRETPRYVLFAHMLCNDSIQLLISSLMTTISWALIRPTKAVCSILVLLTAASSTNTPLNLAAMSLERYVAICFPLRHSEFANTKSTCMAIAAIWFFGLVNPVVESLYISITDPDFFSDQMICNNGRVFITTQWQGVFNQAVNAIYYMVAMLVIIYSYVRVMNVARSLSSHEKSAKKAHKTLLLHLIQLLLCLNTLLYGHIIGLLALQLTYEVYTDVRYTIYLLVILLPRCLSPLIYGLRDETLHCLFMYYFKCGLSGAKPKVNIH